MLRLSSSWGFHMLAREFNERSLRSLLLAGAAASVLAITPAIAQDDAEDEDEIAEENERVTVTGSRIRRDAFSSSASPVQVIDGETAARLGLADTQSLIVQSPVVSGTQLDLTTQTGSPTAAVAGVPDNGPGAATVALRGLGVERTLLLVNGRRLSPSGVRGAPIAPDLNLIPASMIDSVEILTDGASSIYGADAVAGVVNILLRNDFEGFEVNGFYSLPEEDGGEEQRYSIIGGAQSDRGGFTISAEFRERTEVGAGDRDDFTEGCRQAIEVNPQGRVFKRCVDNRPDNAALVLGQPLADEFGGGTISGFLIRTPGSSDIGIPGWSTQDVLPEGDLGLVDTYNLQDEERNRALLQRVRSYSIYGQGSYEIDFYGLDEVYTEFLFSNRQNVDTFPSEQVFPGVPGLIPQEDANGNLLVGDDGAPLLFDNPLNPFDVDALPVNTFASLPQRRETNIDYFRAVVGFRGDINAPFFEERNWEYDIYASYDRSSGFVDQALFFEPNIVLSQETLRLDADGNVTCGVPLDTLGFGFLTPQDCVPVNFFADSIFSVTGGNKDFATRAERDFITGRVTNFTEIEQAMISGFVTGDLFELPAGTVPLVFGLEYRDNRIDTRNSISREAGFQASEVPDVEGPTVGRTSIFEVFAETEIPVIKGVPFIEEFTITPAVRWTEEENFGSQVTWKVGALWKPIDWFTIRGTAGTSFRAPNLREQFLSGSTGTIGGGNDPCIVPTDARDADGNYDPALDNRDPQILENCLLQGADPTQLGINAVVGIPTVTSGNPDLQAETSDNFTVGFVFAQPWFESFDLDIAATYFNIEVSNSVEEFGATDILGACFDEPNLSSPFCGLIERVGSANPQTNFISLVDESFINVGTLTSEGIDVNVRALVPFDVYDQSFDFFVDGAMTYQLEAIEQITEDARRNDRVGEIGFPEIRMNATAGINWTNFTFLWRTRFIDDFQQDDTDPFRVIADGDIDEACPPGETCRDVDFGESVFYHDVSLSYDADTWTATFGIGNIFNEGPPLIDVSEGPNTLNAVSQAGYDFIGRRYFVTLKKSF